MSGLWKALADALRPRQSAVVLMDKSAIQTLSIAEMEVLSANTLYLNVPPVLLKEILGNVAKTFKDGRDPATMVRSLAAKISGLHSAINEPHRRVCAVELLGMAGVPLKNCGILAADARTTTGPDGEGAVLIDQERWDMMIERWRRGVFSPSDLEWAQQWRSVADSFRRGTLLDRLEKHRIVLPKATSIAECLASVDDLLGRATLQAVWLEYLIGELHLGPEFADAVRRRWNAGAGWLAEFAPYAHFCLRAMLAVTSAAKFRLVPWEANTVTDAVCLYYLPFCEMFVSGDRVHERFAPLLMNEHQRYLKVSEVRETLKPLVAAWRARSGDPGGESPGARPPGPTTG